jgi:DNA polymerase-3 subunit beta
MKFKADRATLMKSLAHVQNVVEKRNTIPILANVLLSVKDGALTIAATDLEIALVEEVAAESTRNGAVTVPAATLKARASSSTILAVTRSWPCAPAATPPAWWP